MIDEQRDVFLALSERRDRNREYIKPVEQVFPEPPALDLFLQVPVAGRDDPYIDLGSAGAPQPFKLAVLNDPEQLALQLQRHLADFVEEYGAAVGQLETPDLPGISPGERTLFPTEELAFDEVRRHCRAVDRYHWPVLASTPAVDGACDHSIAGAGLAKEKNCRILGRHLLDPEEYIRDGIALADDLAEVVFPGNILLQVDVLCLEPLFQRLDFRKSNLERLFRPFAFGYLLL